MISLEIVISQLNLNDHRLSNLCNQVDTQQRYIAKT